MQKLFLTGALATLFVASAFGQAKLTGFTASKAGDGVQIQITGDQLGTPKIVRSGTTFYALEFDGTLVGNAKFEKLGYGGVDSVRSLWYKKDKARLAVKARPDSTFEFVKNDTGLLLCINCEALQVKTATETTVSTMPVTKDGNEGEPKKVAKKEPEVKVVVAKTAPKKEATAAYSKPVAYAARVSLDFVNTEIVQILKALAMQANVNIVTAPEVKGLLTVSLQNVTVSEALDLVTTLAGVRYAKVGKTFVVTSDAKFSKTIRDLDGSVPMTSETRVVPIYSGEGTQIKAAMLKSAPMEEGVELVLPSEEITISESDAIGNETAAAPAAGGTPEGDETTVTSTSTNNAKGKTAKKADAFVMLIGPSSRLDKFERMVRTIDEQICRALGKDVPTTSTMVRKMYRPQGSSAATLLQAISGEKAGTTKAKIGNVEAFATPSNSISDQAIVLYGRETEVNQLLMNLENVDSVGQGGSDYMIYEVKYLDPRSLREELIVQVPGLSVSVPSASAASPNSFKSGSITGDSTEKVGQGGTMGVQTAGGESTQVNTKDDTGTTTGLEGPFKELEKVAVPMKLLLRGNKDQIQRGLSYLAAVDVTPKQIALELRVMNLTKEEGIKAGIDWGLRGVSTGDFVPHFGSILPRTGSVSGSFGFKDNGAFDITATLDQIANKQNLIARPNLMAIDGRESEIFVGDIVRYIKSIQATQNGVSVETGEVPIGVRMAVMPHLGGDGSITLDLRPAVSTLKGFTAVPGGGSLPQTGLRVAQNTIAMRDGETIAIGGLIQDDDRKSMGGIPILKDLPLIGFLFRRTDNQRVRTEVVFFLTARVINDGNRTTAANPYENLKKNGGPADTIGK